MKKNASCKAIRTNITNSNLTNMPNTKYVPKKPSHLELLSCKHQQAPKIQFPMSAKSPFELGLRKKTLSTAKILANNQNFSQYNVSPNSPNSNILNESSKAYDQLKNKISSLQGRLFQIKKNFQVSFLKRSDKSKLGKQNQMFRQKQKSKLVLNRNEDKDQKKIKHDENNASKVRLDKQKQNIVIKRNIPLKLQKHESTLQDYVTTFTCQSPTSTLLHCTSQANLSKPFKFNREFKANRYYISTVINAFSNPKPSSFDQLSRNHLITSIDILHFIKSNNRPMPPPPQQRKLPLATKPTLIFDLDETLIHCNENANMPCDILLPIKFPNGSTVKAGINIRPWVKECLEQLSKEFELMIFTASHECYANVIINYIDPKGYITHRFFRDSCWRSQQGFYVKDLRIIDRDLKNVLLIDNAAYSYCFQLDNGVPIIPFYQNKADLQLKSLVAYMRGLGATDNIKQRNASIMKLQDYLLIKEPKQLIARLYQRQN